MSKKTVKPEFKTGDTEKAEKSVSSYSESYLAFFNSIQSIYPISKTVKDAIVSATKEIQLPKGTILFKIGDVVSNAFFIAKGIARTFYYKNEKELTHSICSENKIFTSATSFFTEQPSFEAGELIEDCTLIVISRQKIEKISFQYPDLNYIMRRTGEFFYADLDLRMYSLHMKTAKERYDHLMKTNPDYILRVPLGYIASYLGMTQETLSRLRNGYGQT